MQITQQFSKLTKAKSLYFTNWHQGSGFKKKKNTSKQKLHSNSQNPKRQCPISQIFQIKLTQNN